MNCCSAPALEVADPGGLADGSTPGCARWVPEVIMYYETCVRTALETFSKQEEIDARTLTETKNLELEYGPFNNKR